MHSVHPPPSFLQGWGVGVEPPTKFSNGWVGGDLTGPQLLEGGCWERVMTFFREGGGMGGGCNCHIKNKSKSEILNDKKIL